jgi:hypothetical protein
MWLQPLLELNVFLISCLNFCPCEFAKRLNFLDSGSDDWHGIFRMPKFQVHASANIPRLEHGTTPGGTFQSNQHRLGTKPRMSGYQRLAFPLQNDGIAAVLGLDQQYGFRSQILQSNPALDLRLHDVMINDIAQIRVRPKIRWAGVHATILVSYS